MLGSVLVQVSLFSNAVEVRRHHYDSDVMEAISNAGEDLKNLDLKRMIENEESFKPWLHSQIPNVFAVDSAINPNILDREEVQFLDSTGFYTFSFQADTTYYSPSGPYRVEVSKEGSGRKDEDGKIHLHQAQMNRLEEKVLLMDTILQRFVRSTLRDFVPIDQRFSSEDVQSLLKAEFENVGIFSDFDYALSENGDFTTLMSDHFISSEPSYKVQIMRQDLWDSSIYLWVQMPQSVSDIYQSMWKIIVLSLMFTLGVIVSFWLTIRQWIKQKKISSIKSDFINNMTHEFKTPLATINLALDALNSPKLLNDPTRRLHYTNIIKKENARMHKQVEHVLRMSLLDKDEIVLEKSACELGQLIDNARSHFELALKERGGTMVYHSHHLEGQVIFVDQHHFSNVLYNIIDNAIKYAVEPPYIVVDTRKERGSVSISISDNGIGMSREVREHIFDRFYRAESGNLHTVKGHGLGLAYAKEIIDLHKANIEVKSQMGEGSTFVITLELSE